MLPRPALATLLLVLPGCLPIPWRKTYVMWPEGTVRVIDARTEAPLAFAKLHVVREEYPYRRLDEARDVDTDAGGEARFTKETAVKTVYPLMMHGVPQYAFVVCAEAPGHASKTVSWGEARDGAHHTLEIALVEGSLPCDAQLETAAPAPGEARIEGVERVEGEDDLWRLQLAVRADAPALVGERLRTTNAEMVVTAIEWQGEPVAELRRARVLATGGSGAKFGDVARR